MIDSTETIWRFIRGDLSPDVFEGWACNHAELETKLGRQRYLDLISADFHNRDVVHRLRELLRQYLLESEPLGCECLALADTSVLGMGDVGALLPPLDRKAVRGDPYWWLSYDRCRVCGTPWLAAQEERHNDVYILRRLSEDQAKAIAERNQWPPDFDSFATLLEIGRKAGHHVTFFDPVADSSLLCSMRDIASERPGISVEELGELLNLDGRTARIIATQVVERHGAKIDLGG